jgi:hypothetical protein
VDDAKTGAELIAQVEVEIACVIGDAAYDTAAISAVAGAKGTEVIVPPVKGAVVSRSKLPLSARDTTVLKVGTLGQRTWKPLLGYHHQGRVENTFFRYKQILGGKLRARHTKGQVSEAALACRILNRMGEVSMPRTVPVSA